MDTPTLRRFGKYLFGSPEGIPTSEASYAEGYKTGKTWTDSHFPGGPWTVHPSYFNQDPDWLSCCEATKENNREWLRGWYDGCKEGPNPQLVLSTRKPDNW
jgi:hypothetical protein